eukprot:m.67121 g.67121  ORF g.67121 m.67121 type:complete len:64 (+) comp23765_c2_seq1:136-327(+)
MSPTSPTSIATTTSTISITTTTSRHGCDQRVFDSSAHVTRHCIQHDIVKGATLTNPVLFNQHQ